MKLKIPSLIRLLFITTLIPSILVGCLAQQFKPNMPQSFENKGWGPNGLAWNGRDLVLGDSNFTLNALPVKTGAFFAEGSDFNSDGLSIATRPPFTLSKIEICGLAWEDDCCGSGYLWIADSINKKLIKTGKHRKIIKVVPYHGEGPDGLAFDGNSLWVADSKESKIYKISPDDGTILKALESPIEIPTGLAWDCSNLWIIGMNYCGSKTSGCYEPKLVKIDSNSGTILEEAGLYSQIVKPTSLAWANGYLWIGDRVLNRVFKLPARNFRTPSVLEDRCPFQQFEPVQ